MIQSHSNTRIDVVVAIRAQPIVINAMARFILWQKWNITKWEEQYFVTMTQRADLETSQGAMGTSGLELVNYRELAKFLCDRYLGCQLSAAEHLLI